MPSDNSSWFMRWVLAVAGVTLCCALPLSMPAQVNSPNVAPSQVFRIVYDRMRNVPLAMDAPLFKNIYAINSDGSGEEQLTEDNHSFNPVLSPDGTKIAYIHIKPETCEGCLLPAEYEIYVMNADGTGPHVVAGMVGPDAKICWSPDEKTLSYTGFPVESNQNVPFAPESPLYLVQLGSTASPRLLSHEIGDTFEWSPDGKWIAHGCPAPQKDSRSRIRLCLSETGKGEHFKVLPEGAFPYGFSWSPDGTRLAYVVAGKNTSALFVAGTDGSPPKSLTEVNSVIIAPQWSPDGKQIVFSDSGHGKRAVYVMNADGAARQRLTDPKLRAASPMWSPDGKQIVFTGVVHDRPQTYLVNADGSELRIVTHDEKMGCRNIAWLRDSRLLLLRCGYPQPSPTFPMAASNENLYVVAVDPAGQPRQLTKDGIGAISFAPVNPGPRRAGPTSP
ncbi:MAG: hypothetical protein LAN61_11105 [Acidobacteriia bacterium]|nr:hypothetical protein [Terriglobia bacterium]